VLSENFIRWGGLAALVGAVIGILYFPFHATAYFATQDGASSLDAPWVAAWAEPFARVFDPASHLRSSRPSLHHLRQVRLTGLARLLGGRASPALPTRRTRGPAEEVGLPCAPRRNRIGHSRCIRRVLHTAPLHLLRGVRPPGFLLMMFGSLLFGIGTLRARMTPRLGGWLLTIGGFPGIVVMTVLVGHLSGGLLLLDCAWVLGYALWRQKGGPAERSPRVR
jgi:hypothetical protein